MHEVSLEADALRGMFCSTLHCSALSSFYFWFPGFALACALLSRVVISKVLSIPFSLPHGGGGLAFLLSFCFRFRVQNHKLR